MAWIDLDKLLRDISIVEVAQRLGIETKKEGERTLAICPFHSDTKPSAVLYTDAIGRRPHFHCYACGEHGDAISLVKQVNQTDFKTSVQWLASAFGRNTQTEKKTRKVQQPTSGHGSAMIAAFDIYREKNVASELTRWAKKRRLDPKTLAAAGIAFANANTLADTVAAMPFNEGRELEGELEDASLLRRIRSSTGDTKKSDYLPLKIPYTDFFPDNRIIIPLQNEAGKVVGLVARTTTVDADAKSPKYLVAKGTAKGKLLYLANKVFQKLLAEAKAGQKDQYLYVVEGFFDALRLDSLGIPAVAAMGAQLSSDQVDLINKLRSSIPKDNSLTIRLFLDRDPAGIRGMQRSCKQLLTAGVHVEVVLLKSKDLATIEGANPDGKDPDECFLNVTANSAAIASIERSSYPPAIAFLLDEISGDAEDVISDDKWNDLPRSRRYRAVQKSAIALRKLADSKAELERFICGNRLLAPGTELACQTELLRYATRDATAMRQVSTLFIEDSNAQLNNARLLAYAGSRRGELPCAEPEWERLDIAATAFNVLLTERIAGDLLEPIDYFDAVLVPRKFGGDEPRLKAMPRPADLIVQQYLLNELLSERLNEFCLDDQTFSICIPAVRYYSDEQRVVTTGLPDESIEGGFVADDTEVLSFAYQIDMEVMEGRKPPSDQGMYRPYIDSWRAFMRSLQKQSEEIGVVHSLRLDVKRYYDNLQRFVVRDSIYPNLKAAIEKLGSDSVNFGALLLKEGLSAEEDAAHIVDSICDLLFGYPYLHPEDGRKAEADPNMGIPQGPVLSAWIGNVALFPLDQQARKFMQLQNNQGRRVGYARYVDDVVLIADSAELLNEMRHAIETATRTLGLNLVAKADSIPVLPAKAFYELLNEGRAFAASGPAWEAPLIGDGEQGWGLWSETPDIDRPSALQVFRNSGLFRESGAGIASAIKTAFQASDLRPSEFALGARWLWFAVATEAVAKGMPLDATTAWSKYQKLWDECCKDSGWELNPDKKAWEDSKLFALEGLEKLVDSSMTTQRGLTIAEQTHKSRCLSDLAKLVLKPEFEALALADEGGPRLVHQLKQRYELVKWKAARAVPGGVSTESSTSLRASPFVGDTPFSWLDQAIQQLMQVPKQRDDTVDPLSSLRNPINWTNRSDFRRSFSIAKALLAQDDQEAASAEIVSIALQTIVAVVPPSRLWDVLALRPNLLSSDCSRSLMLPPLPGIDQDRLFACEADKSNHLVSVNSLVAIELASSASLSSSSPDFLGASDSPFNAKNLSVNWATSPTVLGGVLTCTRGTFFEPKTLHIYERAPGLGDLSTLKTPREAAVLFEQLYAVKKSQDALNIALNLEQELVPTWAYVGSADVVNGKASPDVYLLCEPVETKKLANRAFVRDVGRTLRSVSVPFEGAAIWRIGVTVSDLFGLQDDIAKYADHETAMPLTETAIAGPEQYVLRNQLRKLRGAYFNSKALSKIHKESGLPASVRRSLDILLNFPAASATPSNKLLHLLISESETEAMRLRFEGADRDAYPGLKSTLHQVANRVLSKLPVSVGEALATKPPSQLRLRRDLIAISALSRRIWELHSAADSSETSAALKASLVLSTCVTAFRGLVITLRALKGFGLPTTLAMPAGGWPTWNTLMLRRPAATILEALRTDDWHSLADGSALEWLCVLVNQLGANLSLRDPDWSKVDSGLKTIASVLVDFELTDRDGSDCSWPFEELSRPTIKRIDLSLVDSVCTIAQQIDELCGVEVRRGISSRYGYSPQGKRFTDLDGRISPITPSQIGQFPQGAGRIEEIVHDGSLLKIWSEAIERKSRKLLSVHVLGDSFAKISLSDQDDFFIGTGVAGGGNADTLPLVTTATIQQVQDPQDLVFAQREEANFGLLPTTTSLFDEPSAKEQSPPVTDEESTAPKPVSGEVANQQVTDERIKSHGATRHTSNKFRVIQNERWDTRGKQKGPGHVRIALLQWRLDETYSHPISEAGLRTYPFGNASGPMQAARLLADSDKGKASDLLHQATQKRGAESLWTESLKVPSWGEHRRQRLLAAAIDVCERFQADLLVLPEYSVRPETLTWLSDQLRHKGVAVLAGSHRQFDSAPNDLLSAKMSLLWPFPKQQADSLRSSLKTDPHSIAVADWIGEGVVLQWDRLKKYRAVAVGEYIRPSVKPIAPLFEPGDISDWFLDRKGLALPNQILNNLLTTVPMPLKFCQELICSELFLLTSPANLKPMAQDYDAQVNCFSSGSSSKGWTTVIEDIEMLSTVLSIGHGHLGAPRRSILTVPAATSRTADYWIAGQASLLASGTTTVFCNGVLDKVFNGGSCFVGRESWKNGTNSIGLIAATTPYHGWSKGIYYNNPKDALSESDQALVIADIDPFNMLEGKPRPQMLPVPLQLVAYIPIVETLDTESSAGPMIASLISNTAASNPEFVGALEKLITSSKMKSLEKTRGFSLQELSKAIAFRNVDEQAKQLRALATRFSDQAAFNSRTEAFCNDRLQQPKTEPAPALYDWLEVDLTLVPGEGLPKINIPSWTGGGS